MNVQTRDETRLARTAEEYVALAATDADWIVRSPDDLRQLRELDGDPLGRLPRADFDAFVDGLGFAGGGVADGSYRPLMATLTITEILGVFERFGMHNEYALATLEAKCVHPPDAGHGDCEFSFWDFCSSLCGKKVTTFPAR